MAFNDLINKFDIEINYNKNIDSLILNLSQKDNTSIGSYFHVSNIKTTSTKKYVHDLIKYDAYHFRDDTKEASYQFVINYVDNLTIHKIKNTIKTIKYNIEHHSIEQKFLSKSISIINKISNEYDVSEIQRIKKRITKEINNLYLIMEMYYILLHKNLS